MDLLIKPHLTMASRETEPHNLQTIAEMPVPVAVPTLSMRHRVALLMLLTSLWLVDGVVMLLLWQFNMDAVYCFVLMLIAFLVGCMFTGILAAHQYRSQIEDAPLLITQKVRAIHKSDLAHLTNTVTMDTARYLEAIKLTHE